ncbi:MAG: glycosyltransferase family 39 protein [Acidobacteriia bacterium]|nr:glycosyltransferase family 39 protein [Terriglobia bacterium]
METTASSRSAGVPPAVAGASCPRPRGHASALLDLGALALITAAAALLRFHAITAKSFWFDEGVSVAVARLDWWNFVRILWRREANMSLYYLVLRPWLQFGQSEAFIRGLSVVFALAAVPALYLLGRRLFDSRTGLIVAALLSVNAYAVRYSQEARSYSLMLLLCVLSSLCFLKALESPSQRNRLTYVLISALAVYAHFFSGLLVLAQWLALRFLDRESIPEAPRKDWRWIALAVSPVAIFVATTGAGPLRWVQRPGLKELWDFALRLTGNAGPPLLVAYVLACGAALWPGLRQTVQRVSWDAWRYRFLLLWLFFPVLLTLAVSFARPLFLPRYFFFCLPALLLLAAAGMARLRSAWLLAPALLIFVALSLRGTMSYYRQDFDLGRDDWRAATQSVLSQARPGDAVMFQIAMGRMPYEYYHSLLGAAGSPVVLYPHREERITFLDFVEKPDLVQLERSVPQYKRVWLVLSYAETPTGLDPTTQTMENLILRSHSHAQQVFQHPDVVLYTR